MTVIDRTTLTESIKTRALDLGFDKAGIVPAEALKEEHTRLEEWLRRGYHGEMPYMARDPDQRTDPRKVFPVAKSVIVVALNYNTPHQHRTDQASGKISRYAWGDDYHAGLGWMGKHTNVITPEFGSWVFIGELLLNIELDYDDQEIADQCGSCTLCLDACPTNAIVEPYVLDANLCISHATIESRAAEIREDVAAHLEGWLYGCDICQDVCPWNQAAKSTSESRFEPRDGNINAPLDQINELDQEAYANRFRGSAMKRAKLSGLQRNARALLDH